MIDAPKCREKSDRDHAQALAVAANGVPPSAVVLSPFILLPSAECRVTTFLIDLSMRMGNSKYLDLPMTRQDTADHLGLTIETLSRVITKLDKSGSIARTSCRTLVLRNGASLAQLSNQ